LLGLVDRANEKPDLDGEKLDVCEIYLDVANDDEALVQYPIENINQPVGARRRY
jgi:hypothetical protein